MAKVTMATSSAVKCGICQKKHVTNYAEYWCPECVEGLCRNCHEYHSMSKASEKHGCIPVDQYNQLPSSISTIVQHCKDHEIKYTNYCTTHDVLCCPDCISTTHRECKGFLSLREIIKTAKTSTLLNNMEQSLKDIETNIEKVIQNRKQNMSNIKHQRQKFHDDIKKFRIKINSHLDSLEQTLLAKLNAAEKDVETKIRNLIDRLSKERKSVNALKNNIESLKQHASNLQIFHGCKTYQPEVEKAEKYMKSVSEDGSLKQFNLKCTTYDHILEKLEGLIFGSVSIQTGPPSLVLTTEKEKQAQIMTVIPQPSPKSIHDIKLSLLNTYETPKTNLFISNYGGCFIHPSGRLILTDQLESELIVLNEDGTVDKNIPRSPNVNDVTTIDDRTLAVSTDSGIDIINTESKRKEKVIKTDNWSFGITYHKGSLLWCEVSKGIQRMDLSDWSITTLVKQGKLPYNSFLTANEDKIYQTNHETKTVTCYTIKGQKLWEYKNLSVVKEPTGIAVDSNGVCYITTDNNHDVVVVSADGKNGKQLLSHKNGLINPYGIYYEKTKDNLLIVNKYGPAFLYHVQKK